MQDRTINNALLALRKQDGEARELAERLLAMRGVTHWPRIIKNPAGRGEMKRMVLGALRDGSKTRRELVAYVAERRADAPPDRLYWRVDAALSRLRMAGLVGREGRVWSNVEAVDMSRIFRKN